MKPDADEAVKILVQLGNIPAHLARLARAFVSGPRHTPLPATPADDQTEGALPGSPTQTSAPGWPAAKSLPAGSPPAAAPADPRTAAQFDKGSGQQPQNKDSHPLGQSQTQEGAQDRPETQAARPRTTPRGQDPVAQRVRRIADFAAQATVLAHQTERTLHQMRESNQVVHGHLGELARESQRAAAAHGDSLRAIHSAIHDLRRAHEETHSRLRQLEKQGQ